jgi:hypothetical protein
VRPSSERRLFEHSAVENTFARLENRYPDMLDSCIEEAKAGELSVDNAIYLGQGTKGICL